MPLYTPTWTASVAFHASSSVANGGTAQDDLNLAALNYYRARVTLEFDIPSGSPNGDITVEVFGSANGGTSVETIASQKFVVNFTAPGNKKPGVNIDGPWARVKVTNNTGVSVTYVSTYAGLKQTST